GGSHFLALAALLAGAAFAAPVVAGTVYRCESGDGVRSYSSSKVKGSRCTAVSSYTSAPAPKAAPKAAGSATPPNTSSGSPAAASVPAAGSAPAAKPYQAPRLVEGQVYSYI